jgi:hypothetical protein
MLTAAGSACFMATLSVLFSLTAVLREQGGESEKKVKASQPSGKKVV